MELVYILGCTRKSVEWGNLVDKLQTLVCAEVGITANFLQLNEVADLYLET
jgi:hypothetical protein